VFELKSNRALGRRTWKPVKSDETRRLALFIRSFTAPLLLDKTNNLESHH
jgi:hypothetical protein